MAVKHKKKSKKDKTFSLTYMLKYTCKTTKYIQKF